MGPLLDPENKPIKEIEIKIKPKDPSKNITIETVPNLKVCAHPSTFFLLNLKSSIIDQNKYVNTELSNCIFFLSIQSVLIQ